MLDDSTVPTWGYKPDGEARIFDLAPGEGLPEGWHASPTCITDPTLATAEALTARAAGRVFVPPVVNAVDIVPAAASPDTAIAEIERLKGIIAAGMAENERLAVELDGADSARDAAIADAETARAAHEHTLGLLEAATADLDGLRAAFDAARTEKADLVAKAEAIAAELAAARADMEALTAPKPTAKAGK